MRLAPILCIEDDSLIRELLVIQLEQITWNGFKILEAGDARSGLKLAAEHAPELVVLDLLLPDMHGFDVAIRLSELRPTPRVLIVTSTASEAVLERIPYSPIHGFVLKSSGHHSELAYAVNKLLAGETYFSPQVLQAIATARAQPNHYSKILTPREIELLPPLGYGWPYETIAKRTGHAQTKVVEYEKQIIAKLGLRGREELMKWCVRKGFVDFRHEAVHATDGAA
jgi:DNA-binding NarL/FixJ family response regulator